MNTTRSFEKTMADACEALKALRCPADLLVGEIARAAKAMAEEPSHAGAGDHGRAAFDADCVALLARQREAHAVLAAEVETISVTIDRARLSVEQHETPLASDRVIGLLSKRAMRQRMAWRARRSDQGEHLLLAIGRADRMAGIIKSQRDVVSVQRCAAEKSLALLLGQADEQADGRQGLERHGDHFSLLVDALNRAVHDHAVLLHKLTFDVERALDVYRTMVEIGSAGRETLPSAAAYPHFTGSVQRLTMGMVPGARLAASREAAELAFLQRFIAN